MKSLTRCLIVLLAGSVLAGCGNNDNDVARVQPGQQQQPYQPQQQPQYADQSQYGPQTQQQYQQPQQPVIINQAPAQSSGVGDMIMGGALGYMLGSSGNNSSQVRERVVERHVQSPPPVAQSAPRQQYQQPQAVQKPTYNGWSKPAATQPVAAKPVQYGGWSKPAVSKPSTPAPTRSQYSGFSKRR